MRDRKGQGIIIEVLAFAMSMMLAVIVFYVMISTGGITEQSAEESITYELGELKKRSAVSITMNDHIWRIDSVDKGKYADWPAYKVFSHYLSTPGDKMHIYDNEIDMDEVQEDLINYIRHKMDKYWQDGPNDIDYRFIAINEEASERPRNITVSTYKPGEGGRISYPLSLTGGREAEVALWTRNTENIQTVSGADGS
jgi:hypothetical protein